MDPSIMKLLEDDEDESMYSGADVEAFTEVLNRDIAGDACPNSQPSDSPSGVLSQGNIILMALHGYWQNINQGKELAQQIQQQQVQHHLQSPELYLSQVEPTHQGSSAENPIHCHILEPARLSESQEQHMLQQSNSHQATSASLANNSLEQISPIMSDNIPILMQILCPYLDKDRSMQLQAIYTKLKNNQITMEVFSRFSKNIVGFQIFKQAAHLAQIQNQMRSMSSPLLAGTIIRTPKAIIGQKTPVEGLDVSPPHASKKQKTCGAFHDQSIEQLNDVTAISGVNLREEEEQLFSALKKEDRVLDATRKNVQKEEERLILQKGPLQKKLAEITSKCGIVNISSDVEHCLSMCVEERLRGLIRNLIRFSEQRIDSERKRHQFVFTSDIRHQVLAMNHKGKVDWEKKQAEEAKKLQNLNEQGSKDTDGGCSKTHKIDKEEEDRMRTTAANIAVQAALGGDDMHSKWQLMAEQARQKRDGRSDCPCGAQPDRTLCRKLLPSFSRALREQAAGKRGFSAASVPGGMRKSVRSSVATAHPKFARIISTKDVIAVLEREPQMSRSALIYRLYERLP